MPGTDTLSKSFQELQIQSLCTGRSCYQNPPALPSPSTITAGQGWRQVSSTYRHCYFHPTMGRKQMLGGQDAQCEYLQTDRSNPQKSLFASVPRAAVHPVNSLGSVHRMIALVSEISLKHCPPPSLPKPRCEVGADIC